MSEDQVEVIAGGGIDCNRVATRYQQHSCSPSAWQSRGGLSFQYASHRACDRETLPLLPARRTCASAPELAGLATGRLGRMACLAVAPGTVFGVRAWSSEAAIGVPRGASTATRRARARARPTRFGRRARSSFSGCSFAAGSKLAAVSMAMMRSPRLRRTLQSSMSLRTKRGFENCTGEMKRKNSSTARSAGASLR
jgi:hypothetical protein